ncbi:MAG: hypothetical protein IJ371_03890 [Clostridia bacterium]|nr:hypothetical protein [Clostridia bacterium]
MERAKMPRIKRAAQFAPFDALKGLHDALERKRQEHVNSIKQQKDISSTTNLQISKNAINGLKNEAPKEEN